MKEGMPNIAFKMMTHIGIPIRNLFNSPQKIMNEVEIKQGDKVLEYGCGPGTFTCLLAEKAGETGKIYALDCQPLASKYIEKKARKKNLKNIETIISDCKTTLDDNSIDKIVFIDVYHLLNNKKEVLAEMQRVLKSEGKMFFSDHHLKDKVIENELTKANFKLKNKGEYIIELKNI